MFGYPNFRRRALPFVLLFLAILVAGCGGSTAPRSSAGAADERGFPVTVEHKLGATEVTQRPRRVVALGTVDVQIARALDAPIVGAVENGEQPDGQWLGVEPPLSDDVELLSPAEPEIEKIAALRPDLILITGAQPAFADAYDTLSRIAPTIAYRKGLLEDSGTDLTRLIGRATGRDDRAEALIDDAQGRVRQWAQDHPQLVGRRIALGQYAARQTFLIVAADAPSTTLFRELGMRLPDALAELPVQAPPGVTTVADERLDVLRDADWILFGLASRAEGRTWRDQPLVRRLPAVRAGRFRALTYEQTGLLLTTNPATTPAILRLIDEQLR